MSAGSEILRWHAEEIYLQRPEYIGDNMEYPPIINVLNFHHCVVDVPMEMRPTQVVRGSPESMPRRQEASSMSRRHLTTRPRFASP